MWSLTKVTKHLSLSQYLSPEPLLQEPGYMRQTAHQGMSVPNYAYAFNNPLFYVDPDGLAGTCSGGRCNTLPGSGTGELVDAAGQAAAAAAAEKAAECAEDEATKNRCAEHFEKCVQQGGNYNRISNKNTCGRCLDSCTTFGFWPAAVYGKGGKREVCRGG